VVSNTNDPLMRITCRHTQNVRVGNYPQQALLLSAEDVQLLRSLSGRDFCVSLVCPGQSAHHVNVKPLLKTLSPIPGQPFWYLPTALAGSLQRAVPYR
jgi:hypothetical protein